jgi:transcriptional repressor NrdR
MRCPYCKNPRTKVIDSRDAKGGDEIRRRRHCDVEEAGCGRRFTTFERLERRMPVVVKRGGGRVPYERDKVRNGLLRATWKRPIREAVIEDFLDELERRLAENFIKEVTTEEIGREVSRFLKDTDQVAYVRFQSVYGDFQNIDEFRSLLSTLNGEE